jgi:hypothetical protein
MYDFAFIPPAFVLRLAARIALTLTHTSHIYREMKRAKAESEREKEKKLFIAREETEV